MPVFRCPILPHLPPFGCIQSLQLCPTLCDPMDCSLPGASVHGIFPASILEWVAIPFDLPDPGIKPVSPSSLHWQVGSLL